MWKGNEYDKEYKTVFQREREREREIVYERGGERNGL
jgi:hypothetical protein